MKVRLIVTGAALVALAAGVLAASVASGGGDGTTVIRDAALGQIKPGLLVETHVKNGATVSVTKQTPFFSGGLLTAAKAAYDLERAVGADTGSAVDLGGVDLGSVQGSLGCSRRDGHGNERVNQDCGFRRQAEEDIAINPTDPRNLIAGQNDSRVGFNQCGVDWSTDGGRHWGDMLPPFRARFNSPVAGHTVLGGPGTGHTYDAGSDPTVAFDSAGRAFFSCLMFDINSNASGLYVTASPAGAKGSFYFTLPSTGSRFIVAEDNAGTTPNGDVVSHDKQFIAADAFPGSPNRDNVYVTWTVFYIGSDGSYHQSPIFGSMSTDHAQTWSPPEQISGSSQTLCFFGNFFDPSLDEHSCNFNQGSDPVVLPNGDLVVTFNNGNTPATVPFSQQLAVHCRPAGSSTAGTAKLNCDPPVKVGDDITTGAPACDFGRGPEECVPGPSIRTNDFPRIAVGRTSGNLYVAWQDYRNGEFDVQLARSTDGGATWSPSSTVNPDTGLDHYMPAIDVASFGGRERVAVSYYRSETGPPGGAMSDYVLAGGSGTGDPFDFRVLSPPFSPPDGNQAGFNGDYSGLAVGQSLDAHPIWSDTRNADPFTPANGVVHDEDIFTDSATVPFGKARTGPGQIGSSG